MRELKFRAWDGDSMIYLNDIGAYVCNGKFGQTIQGEQYLEEYPLMQYTGLKDKNGKEIYEGDIVSFEGFPHEWNFSKPQVIEFLNYGWHPFTYGVPASHSMEIIGNIYQNPELINL